MREDVKVMFFCSTRVYCQSYVSKEKKIVKRVLDERLVNSKLKVENLRTTTGFELRLMVLR